MGSYPREMKTYVHTKAFMYLFIGALFIKARNWKQPGDCSAGEWLNKLVHSGPRYHSAVVHDILVHPSFKLETTIILNPLFSILGLSGLHFAFLSNAFSLCPFWLCLCLIWTVVRATELFLCLIMESFLHFMPRIVIGTIFPKHEQTNLKEISQVAFQISLSFLLEVLLLVYREPQDCREMNLLSAF